MGNRPQSATLPDCKSKKNKWLPGTGSIGFPSRPQSMTSSGCHQYDPVTIRFMLTSRWAPMPHDGGA